MARIIFDITKKQLETKYKGHCSFCYWCHSFMSRGELIHECCLGSGSSGGISENVIVQADHTCGMFVPKKDSII